MEDPIITDEDEEHSGQEQRKERREYDLTSASGLDEYWTALEYVFVSKRDHARRCFPATMAPEVVGLPDFPQFTVLKWNFSVVIGHIDQH